MGKTVQFSLTDFVDIASSIATSKVRKTIAIRDRPEYAPYKDYWRPVRELIIDIHKNGKSKSLLKQTASLVNKPEKAHNFATLGNAYHTWMGKKTFEWFDPPYASITEANFTLRINPELGLLINGKPHVVKLYFKAEGLTKRKAELVNHIMATRLKPKQKCQTAVLDIRNKKLICGDPSNDLEMVLIGELAFLAKCLE